MSRYRVYPDHAVLLRVLPLAMSLLLNVILAATLLVSTWPEEPDASSRDRDLAKCLESVLRHPAAMTTFVEGTPEPDAEEAVRRKLVELGR